MNKFDRARESLVFIDDLRCDRVRVPDPANEISRCLKYAMKVYTEAMDNPAQHITWLWSMNEEVNKVLYTLIETLDYKSLHELGDVFDIYISRIADLTERHVNDVGKLACLAEKAISEPRKVIEFVAGHSFEPIVKKTASEKSDSLFLEALAIKLLEVTEAELKHERSPKNHQYFMDVYSGKSNALAGRLVIEFGACLNMLAEKNVTHVFRGLSKLDAEFAESECVAYLGYGLGIDTLKVMKENGLTSFSTGIVASGVSLNYEVDYFSAREEVFGISLTQEEANKAFQHPTGIAAVLHYLLDGKGEEIIVNEDIRYPMECLIAFTNVPYEQRSLDLLEKYYNLVLSSPANPSIYSVLIPYIGENIRLQEHAVEAGLLKLLDECKEIRHAIPLVRIAKETLTRPKAGNNQGELLKQFPSWIQEQKPRYLRIYSLKDLDVMAEMFDHKLLADAVYKYFIESKDVDMEGIFDLVPEKLISAHQGLRRLRLGNDLAL